MEERSSSSWHVEANSLHHLVQSVDHSVPCDMVLVGLVRGQKPRQELLSCLPAAAALCLSSSLLFDALHKDREGKLGSFVEGFLLTFFCIYIRFVVSVFRRGKRMLKTLKTVGIGSSMSPFTKTLLFLALSTVLLCSGWKVLEQVEGNHLYCLDLCQALKEPNKLC